MVGTIEQALDMKRRPQAHELTEYDLKQIGTFVRFEIPMTDMYKLRQVADLLRGFANLIDTQTRRTDLSVRTILVELKFDASLTASRIKDLFPEVFKRRYTGHGPQD